MIVTYLGDSWLVGCDGYTATLEEPELAVTKVTFNPGHVNPLAAMSRGDVDAVITEARTQIERLRDQPEYEVARWATRTRHGRPVGDDVLADVVAMRTTMSAAEIADKIGRSTGQVFRYLQVADERGIA